VKEPRQSPSKSKPPATFSPNPRLMDVTERVCYSPGEPHPGWGRSTQILLRGVERLRCQEAAQQQSVLNAVIDESD